MRKLILAIWILTGCAIAFAQKHPAGYNRVPVRGKELQVYFYPAAAGKSPVLSKVLYLPGDLGLHLFGATIAETIASQGYDVFALDTRQYLDVFTEKDTSLSTSNVMNDLGQMLHWVIGKPGERVALVGWSEGAGLCVLAAAAASNQELISGLITLGLTETHVLGWRWIDFTTYLTGGDPNEPTFRAVDFLGRVAPIPILMVQSTGDQFISEDKARQLFSVAREPKKFITIKAQNHRFAGNQGELYRTINEGLQWIKMAPR